MKTFPWFFLLGAAIVFAAGPGVRASAAALAANGARGHV